MPFSGNRIIDINNAFGRNNREAADYPAAALAVFLSMGNEALIAQNLAKALRLAKTRLLQMLQSLQVI